MPGSAQLETREINQVKASKPWHWWGVSSPPPKHGRRTSAAGLWLCGACGVLALLACQSSDPSAANELGAEPVGGSGNLGTGGDGAIDNSVAGALGSGGNSEAMNPELPLSSPGITYIQEDELGFAAVDGSIIPRQ